MNLLQDQPRLPVHTLSEVVCLRIYEEAVAAVITVGLGLMEGMRNGVLWFVLPRGRLWRMHCPSCVKEHRHLPREWSEKPGLAPKLEKKTGVSAGKCCPGRDLARSGRMSEA
jgi:hypothetical protein